MTAMTPERFRLTAAWQRARARALRGATHCALCGGALRFDVRPRHRSRPPLTMFARSATLDLNTAADRAIALDPALLRPCHIKCNSSRGDGGRPRRRQGAPGAAACGHQLAPQLVRADPATRFGPPEAVSRTPHQTEPLAGAAVDLGRARHLSDRPTAPAANTLPASRWALFAIAMATVVSWR